MYQNSTSVLLKDYSDIYDCYKQKADLREILSKWNEIKSRADKIYLNKLFILTVSKLISNVRIVKRESAICGRQNSGLARRLDTIQALKECEDEVAMVLLMAKHADVCFVNEHGYRAVDYLLPEIIGHKATYDQEEHRLKNLEYDQYLNDELTLKLLYAVLNKSVLNSCYKWGYSYFSLFILLSWWDVVRWGLNCGADVSDNGVCPNLPLDAAFFNKHFQFLLTTPRDIFVRLFHPTNVNRPTLPADEGQDHVLPLHKAVRYFPQFIPHLLNAGARIDVRNNQGKLPMDVCANYITIGERAALFHHLIPRSVGISPTLFIKIMHNLKLYGNEAERELFTFNFCEHLRLSSGLEYIYVYTIPSGFLISTSTTGPIRGRLCMCEILCIINTFTKCGIRARMLINFPPTPPYPSDPSAGNNSNNQHNINAVKNAWNKYTTSVPSLFLQCVGVIRSCLQIVTDERVAALPIPPAFTTVFPLSQSSQKYGQPLHNATAEGRET